MKKSYIVLTFIAVFGASAIALFPSKDDSVAQSTTTPGSVTPTSSALTKSTTSNSTSSAAQASTNTSGTYTNGTYKGSVEATPFGDVQISIIVSNGKISDVTFLQMPQDDNHSAQLSRQASTRLESQTISAQSTNISGMSGATYTSEAYINSLQAAIDTAKGA